MYIVTDATVYNDEWVYFSWELSRKVTQYKGNIYFIVCAVKADSNGNITNEWNTTLAEGKVLEGLKVETNQEQQYQASDYLEQLKQQLLDYSKEIKDTFPSDYTEMSEDVKNLKGNKVDKTEFRSTLQTVFAYIADIRAYIGLTDEKLVGIQVDYKNKTFKRLAGAANLTKCSDFDKFTMFGGRWIGGGIAGAFYWLLDSGAGARARDVGGRLVYIPTKDSSVYNASIASWKEQMAI